MAPQFYLITPADADPARFPATLMGVLDAAQVSALLVTRGGMNDAAYASLAVTIINIGQGAGCAVLLEDDVALVRRLGADGVHVNGGPAAVTAAIAAIKPSLIVGAGNPHSRHDAMTVGEMDIDYVFFAPQTDADDGAAADLAQWWAETFEVPAVLSQPDATPGTADARGAEFLALSESIWTAPSPAQAMQLIAGNMGISA